MDDRDDRRNGDRSRTTRARAGDYFEGERAGGRARGRERSRSLDRERDREREERRAEDRNRPRRPSPEYSEYRRPTPPHMREDSPAPPWRQQENMYPGKQNRAPLGAGPGFLESRRKQREDNTLSIWPSSPKAPARSSPSPDSRRHKKSKKRRRDSSATSSTDTEEERRRHERKERKKAKKEKERHRDKDRLRKSRSRSVRRYGDSEEEEDRHQRSRHRSKHSRSRSVSEERRRSRSRERSYRSKPRTKSPDDRPPTTDDEDQWVEKPSASLPAGATAPSKAREAMVLLQAPAAAATSLSKGDSPEDDSDEEVGPQPLEAPSKSRKVDERQYGGALLRGEGSAMAAFLKDGTDVRIPRRGEIGLTSGEIATFENVGYVMSGSRHRRMNAVRMRKENQVISAEEKRGILQLQKEERERREAILREEFQELVKDKLKSSGTSK
ncbi:uncharacterized protein PHACADRAFT_257880 [Phanerochaete carnosa HHB-10118-sp]|uniref:NF-kappa-B-activating protein C-terminal domain-containing protein n=1 Tax=Phanerochaete carnosa (strain HHB-10118-sp) TaxID=650164 RepID=K5WUQ9_PHACS|nr:uncharacterized protein PHACADRAFT_257880 [Phanerochaete carnosa HHB-10118-sp]EKM54202.1 hypothetical protein PHACADRAFT_257880 [Phanerochaete carnosa HHB-10118-sp]